MIWVYTVYLGISVYIYRLNMVPNLELQIREGIHIIFFLFLYKNICCGYSLEAPRPGASHMYHKICFCGEISKISVLFCWKMCLYLEDAY